MVLIVRREPRRRNGRSPVQPRYPAAAKSSPSWPLNTPTLRGHRVYPRQSRAPNPIIRTGEPRRSVALAVRPSLQDLHRTHAASLAFGRADRVRKAIACGSQQQPRRGRAGYGLFRAKPLHASFPRYHRRLARCMATRNREWLRGPRPRSHSQREMTILMR
jgi:hypothetical protein